MTRLASVCAAALVLGLVACAEDDSRQTATASEAELTAIERTVTLGPGESVITLVGTNDVHGSFASAPRFAGYVNALRAHHREAYPQRHAILVLDAGDAVQGTLASNYSEGLLAVGLMNAVGYTAAVAGNHGFDFGPVDWTLDQCSAAVASCDPLGALRRYVGAARFPFLGANVTERATGQTLTDLPPYVLVPHDGRTIAVLGLENHFTDRTTVPENVAHLSFGDGVNAVQSHVEALFTSGRADVFVAVAHEGDAGGSARGMHDWLARLPRRSDGQPLLDAVIAGHTHFVNDAVSGDVPYVQSGANGEMFGLVSLVVRKGEDGRISVDRQRTRKQGGIAIREATTSFFGKPVTPDENVARILSEGMDAVAAIANEHLATTDGLTRTEGRLSDSEIGNFLTDAMRTRSGASLALINGGDVRDDIEAGVLDFGALFEVLPKNLRLVRSTIATDLVAKNLRLAIETCGRRGAMQLSGVRVVFERDCDRAVDGVDPRARLLSIVADDGQVLYRGAAVDEALVPNIDVVTTDFVMSGGAGYRHFASLPMPNGIPLRAEVAAFARDRAIIESASFARGRYINCLEPPRSPLCPPP